MCGHVTDELVSFRSYCERVAPSPPATTQQHPPPMTLPPPTAPFNFPGKTSPAEYVVDNLRW